MQLYACGSNEAANLKSPPSCQRYHIRRSNPCIHNDWGKDPNGLPYCPNMVLSAAKIATADHIRVLASLPDATILDVDGELKILGRQYPELLAEESLVRQADGIKMIFELKKGMAELGMLLEDGDLLLLALGKDGGKTLERYRPAAGRAIYHLTFGLYPSRVLAIPRYRPDTILHFASWDVFLGWHKGNDVMKPNMEVIELLSTIDHLIGNMHSFTVLLRSGQVCSLSPQPTTSQAAVASTPTSAEASEDTTASTAKADSEEPDISDLLADTPSSPVPSKPPPTFLHLAFIPIPTRVKSITTHPSSKVTGITTAKGKAYLLGPPPTPNSDTPTLPSLAPSQTPRPIDFPLINGTEIVSLAVGQSHAVILTSAGEIFSAGDGKAGQLGIGDVVFKLRASDQSPGVKYHPLADEPDEYADYWQRVHLTPAEKGQVREVVAGAETTFFLTQ